MKRLIDIMNAHWKATHAAQGRAFSGRDLVESRACAAAIRVAHHYRKEHDPKEAWRHGTKEQREAVA